MGTRISAVEREPTDDFKHYKRLVAGAVISAVLSSVVVAVLSLIMNMQG